MTKLMMLAMGTGLLLASGSRMPLLKQAPPKEASRLNPYQDQENARQAGQKLYERECSACHGRNGGGSERAPGLVSPVVRQAPPGAIFWVLRNGSLRRGMPSFSHLPEQRRWQIVTYLKLL
jgi:mono/diheme cytochrome c family protein